MNATSGSYNRKALWTPRFQLVINIASFEKPRPRPTFWKQIALIFVDALAVVIGIFLPILTGVVGTGESGLESKYRTFCLFIPGRDYSAENANVELNLAEAAVAADVSVRDLYPTLKREY